MVCEKIFNIFGVMLFIALASFSFQSHLQAESENLSKPVSGATVEGNSDSPPENSKGEEASKNHAEAAAAKQAHGEIFGSLYSDKRYYGKIWMDCSHEMNKTKGANQNCLSVKKLEFGMELLAEKDITGIITIDPFAGYSGLYERLPLYEFDQTRQTLIAPIAYYEVTWQPKTNLFFSIMRSTGAVKYPSLSGLSSAAPFSNIDWYQTAIKLAYKLPLFKVTNVGFYLGNGEGENGKNLDVQQYFGFNLATTFVDGLTLDFGMALDGNNVGSEQSLAEKENPRYASCLSGDPEADVGYSTQRISAGVVIDGNFHLLRGFKMGVGYVRSEHSDLNKFKNYVKPGNDCGRLNPDTIFVEDETGKEANTVTSTIYGINFSYMIFDKVFLGIDYQTRELNSQKIAGFFECESFSLDGKCSVRKSGINKLEQSSFGIGLGFTFSEVLEIGVDYSKKEYNKVFDHYYYIGRNESPSDVSELINIRFSYSTL